MPTPNENDEISSDIGDSARGVAAGKHIRQQQQDNQQTVNVNVDLYTVYLFLTEMRAEISFVKRDVADVKGDVGDVKGDVADVKKDLADVKGDIKTVQGDVTLAHVERTTLIDQVAEIKRDRYPRWFQLLIIALAIAMIVLVSIFLAKVW